MDSSGGGAGSGDGPMYSFFRNLRSFFGIPHRLEPGDPNRRDKALTVPSSADVYDDTRYADPNSFVQGFDQNRGNGSSNSCPNSVDNDQENSGQGQGGKFPFGGRGFDENHPFDPFGFGNVFGQMDAFVREMEKAFAGMDKHFDGFGFPNGDDDRPSKFGWFNDPIIDRDENVQDGSRDRGKLIPYNRPNLRAEVLKPGGDDDGSGAPNDSIDSDVIGPQPNPTFRWGSNRSTFESSSEQVFSSGGKIVRSHVYSQTIRDTPEGREITTFRQNPDGTTEKSTEFIRREDLPKDASGGGEQLKPFGVIGDFFRPRI